MKKTNYRLIYRLFWLVIALVALFYTVKDNVKSMGGSGLPSALYYTNWSVWICFLALATTLGFQIYDSKHQTDFENHFLVRTLKFTATIMVIATFIVSAFVLPTNIFTSAYWTSMGSIFKHFLLPIITVVDVFLNEKTNKLKWYTPLLGVITSLVYWFVVILRAVIWMNGEGKNPLVYMNPANYNRYFPYGFTNLLPKFTTLDGSVVGGHSLIGLCMMLLGILIGLILIGYGFFAYDKFKKTK